MCVHLRMCCAQLHQNKRVRRNAECVLPELDLLTSVLLSCLCLPLPPPNVVSFFCTYCGSLSECVQTNSHSAAPNLNPGHTIIPNVPNAWRRFMFARPPHDGQTCRTELLVEAAAAARQPAGPRPCCCDPHKHIRPRVQYSQMLVGSVAG